MAEAQDVDTLKRRGRRRLVGAVALVLAAVIVLPMVFDPEPRKSHPPVSVRIPGEDDSKFAPKPPPKAVEAPKPEATKQEAAKADPRPEAKAEAKPEAKAQEKKAEARKPDDAEKARAQAALSNIEYVVQVGAFANPDGVVAKLKGAGLPYYTELSQGSLTRVRAGPFASKAAADKALEQLKGLGLQPGAVTTKSG
jgi:DedD protein